MTDSEDSSGYSWVRCCGCQSCDCWLRMAVNSQLGMAASVSRKPNVERALHRAGLPLLSSRDSLSVMRLSTTGCGQANQRPSLEPAPSGLGEPAARAAGSSDGSWTWSGISSWRGAAPTTGSSSRSLIEVCPSSSCAWPASTPMTLCAPNHREAERPGARVELRCRRASPPKPSSSSSIGSGLNVKIVQSR
jgi:hypothetical protein